MQLFRAGFLPEAYVAHPRSRNRPGPERVREVHVVVSFLQNPFYERPILLSARTCDRGRPLW